MNLIDNLIIKAADYEDKTVNSDYQLVISPVTMHAQYLGKIKDMTKVKVSIPLKALPFDYSDVRLLDDPIKRAIKEEIVAPFYTLHKVYAGLFDQYTLCNNQQAFDVLMGMYDWTYNKLKLLNHSQLRGMLSGEFGGMKSSYLGSNVTYIK